jgi:hypothetical protein
MSLPRFRTFSIAVVIAFAVLVLTACTAEWEEVHLASLSADERTLTVDLIFRPPNAEGEFCQRVTNTEVSETPSEVIIGIQVDDNCRSWPWENEYHQDIGNLYPVKLELQAPLAGRDLINKGTRQRVNITRSADNP